MGSHFLLQGIFLTQELNLGLLHWQADSLPTELRGKPSVVQSSYKQYISELVYLCPKSDLQWQAAGPTTEKLSFHRFLHAIVYILLLWEFGEGNGNPLQCSCLENPRDGGAWWAAVYGVAQSGTRLKRLSSSSIVRIMAVLHVCMWPGIRF